MQPGYIGREEHLLRLLQAANERIALLETTLLLFARDNRNNGDRMASNWEDPGAVEAAHGNI